MLAHRLERPHGVDVYEEGEVSFWEWFHTVVFANILGLIRGEDAEIEAVGKGADCKAAVMPFEHSPIERTVITLEFRIYERAERIAGHGIVVVLVPASEVGPPCAVFPYAIWSLAESFHPFHLLFRIIECQPEVGHPGIVGGPVTLPVVRTVEYHSVHGEDAIAAEAPYD